MRKLSAMVLLFVLALITVSGCWSRRELNHLTIILGAALDLKNDHHYITVMGTDPTQGGGGKERSQGSGQGSPFVVTSAEGKTIFEAARNLSLIMPRRNYWAHCEVVLVSEGYAREKGLRELLDFFTRDHERRRETYLIVTRGQAGEMLKVMPTLSQYPAREIIEQIRLTRISAKGLVTILNDFIAQSEGVTRTSLVNYMDIRNYGGNPEIPGQGEEKVQAGAGVFYNYKLIGLLNTRETRGANWLRDNIKTGVISFAPEGEREKNTVLQIDRVKTKMKPLLKEEGGQVKYTIEVTGSLVEYGGKADITKKETVKMLEKACSEEIEKEIREIWKKAQRELKTDIFLLGDKFAHAYPFLLKTDPSEWQEFFMALELELEVKTKINSAGVRGKPV
ncbi:Ger(x)C family spore germination protein [Thermanaerosceptrum fracticalcis]|nr:Ger(x)C family spore germination protein [Thermanaerosceptrum fracticalcis]